MGVRCGARTAGGRPCRAWAVQGSDPPRCSAHGGGRGSVGAPEGNRNAQTHGAYARGVLRDGPVPGSHGKGLERVIGDLEQRLAQLTRYINGNLAKLETDAYVRLVNLQGQLASRLGRLMRDQQEVGGGEEDELVKAIHQALDELGDEWGVAL